MKKLGILSDTHGCWDERFGQYFAGCDEIWHAGDIGDYSIIEQLEELCTVRAVAGNVDHGMVRRKCNELEIFTVEGVKVLLTHIGGYPGRWSPGLERILKEERISLAVDGHSHILKIMRDDRLDLLHINPGAAGKQGWHKTRTLVRIAVDGTKIRDCEVIELH